MLVPRQTAGMEAERILFGGSPICIMHEHVNTGCCPDHQIDMKEEVVAPTINFLGRGIRRLGLNSTLSSALYKQSSDTLEWCLY